METLKSPTPGFSGSTRRNMRSPGVEDANTIGVYVRVKPINPTNSTQTDEKPEKQEKCKVIDGQNLQLTDPNGGVQQIAVTEVFPSSTTQQQLFEKIIQQELATLCDGQNIDIVAYGTSNSGKTHTIFGSPGQPGLIPLSLEFLFSQINAGKRPYFKINDNYSIEKLSNDAILEEIKKKNKIISTPVENEVQTSEDMLPEYLIWVSFAEIHNNMISDLFSESKQFLQIDKNESGQEFIKLLTTVFVSSASEALKIFEAAKKKLTVVRTTLNPTSSRSHSLITIFLLRVPADLSNEEMKIRKFSFCDLGRSERTEKAGTFGINQKEGCKMNQALTVLKQCLQAVYEKRSVPYQESRVTHFLRGALFGEEMMKLITTIDMEPHIFEETKKILDIAGMAKKVVIAKNIRQPRKRKTSNTDEDFQDHDFTIKKKKEETMKNSSTTSEDNNEPLKAENALLRKIIDLTERLQEVEAEKKQMVKNYEEQIQELSRKLKEEKEINDQNIKLIDQLTRQVNENQQDGRHLQLPQNGEESRRLRSLSPNLLRNNNNVETANDVTADDLTDSRTSQRARSVSPRLKGPNWTSRERQVAMEYMVKKRLEDPEKLWGDICLDLENEKILDPVRGQSSIQAQWSTNIIHKVYENYDDDTLKILFGKKYDKNKKKNN